MRESTDALEIKDAPAIGEARTPYLRRLLRRRLPVLAATIGVLTVLGPFGTFTDLGFGTRLLYWGGLLLLGSAVFDGAARLGRAIVRRHGRGWQPMLAGVVLAVALVQTAVVAVVERSLRKMDLLHPAGLAELFVYVLVVTLAVSALPLWLELRDRGLIDPPQPAPPPADPAKPDPLTAPEGAGEGQPAAPPRPARMPDFLDRIPDRLGRDLLALEMEDHYLRVHTAAGSDLILMRLRDAVAELAAIDGLQVHRSYWVAGAAVREVERTPDGRMVLVLCNGLRVPVSRSYAAAVRQKQWAERP